MKDVVYKILWATIEDFVGLWEIHWELNSLFPEKSKTDNKEVSRKILLYFLDVGLVKFYLNEWGNDDVKELRINEAKEIINEDKYWDAPSLNDTCIKVGNTEKGEKYYNEEMINDLIL